eukprot:5353750-Prymnesium_polylepis.1
MATPPTRLSIRRSCCRRVFRQGAAVARQMRPVDHIHTADRTAVAARVRTAAAARTVPAHTAARTVPAHTAAAHMHTAAARTAVRTPAAQTADRTAADRKLPLLLAGVAAGVPAAAGAAAGLAAPAPRLCCSRSSAG